MGKEKVSFDIEEDVKDIILSKSKSRLLTSIDKSILL